jgi:kinesin family protein 18/19
VNGPSISLVEERGFQSKQTSFQYDGVFDEQVSTEAVYHSAISPLVSSVLEGFNSTCFAYGITSAGKTFTMLGDYTSDTPRSRGLVILALSDCLGRVGGIEAYLKLSYLEIYNEQVKDLLTEESKHLMVVEDPTRGTHVPELSEFEVSNLSQVVELIVQGNSRRTMASTGANQLSTRSHAILQVTIEQVKGPEVLSSKLSLIDLAGSERASSTENRGQRLVESTNINRSLLALGNCINILSDSNKRGKFIPYRDSKLTRLLKDSLGGNTKTVMIACVSPAGLVLDETLHTLKYAERARSIELKTSKNVKDRKETQYRDIIVSLKGEIDNLRTQLGRDSPSVQEDLTAEMTRTHMEREALEAELIKGEGRGGSLDELAKQLASNFEENWEVKASIRELDELNEENRIKVKALLQAIQGSRHNEELKLELKELQRSIKENEQIRAELTEALYANMKQKAGLQRTLSSMHSDKRRELLELQIALRTLKMEKLDLDMQNCQMRQMAIEARRQSEAKDKEILEIRQQLETMRKALNKKHTEVSVVLDVSPENKDYSLRSLPKQPLTLIQDNLPVTDRAAPPNWPTDFSSRRLSEVHISTLDKVRDLWKPTLKSKQFSDNTVDFLTKYTPTHEEPRAKTPKVLTITLERPTRSSSAIGKRQSQTPVSVNGGYITSNKRGAFSYLHQIKAGRAKSVSKRPTSRAKTCAEPSKCLDSENTERPFEFSNPETPLSRVSADC